MGDILKVNGRMIEKMGKVFIKMNMGTKLIKYGKKETKFNNDAIML